MGTKVLYISLTQEELDNVQAPEDSLLTGRSAQRQTSTVTFEGHLFPHSKHHTLIRQVPSVTS